MNNHYETSTQKTSWLTWRRLLGTFLVIFLVLAVIMGWWVKRHIYASPFQPTQLSTEEQQELNAKLYQIEQAANQQETPVTPPPVDNSNDGLQPEPYSEQDSQRSIRLSEREINALIAREPELARRMVVDLADDLVSVKFLIPLDPEFPIIGGKTLRVNFGVALRYENRKPVVIIRGVSLGGIPLPGAWWGDIKNKNLVEEFGDEGGFWDQFSKGVADIGVREGELWVKLKE